MNIIGKRKVDSSKNVFYGIDVNDKVAVQKEYERLQKKHRKITILVIIVLAILAFIFFDFCRVNYAGGKPIFAISSSVDRGTLFQGLGYKVLYCENGERYIGSVLYKSCEETDINDFRNFVYELFVNYSVANKTLDKDNLESLVINTVTYDEDNAKQGSDYLLNISVTCKDGSTKCFKIDKEYNDYSNIYLYISINRYNEISQVFTFKASGVYFEELNAFYTDQVKEYLIMENMLNEENLRDFHVVLVSNNGKDKFRGVTYADSYLVKVQYLCTDNGNDCVTAFDKEDYEGDYANLSFYSSMFLNDENQVILVGPKEYLELD